MLPTIKKVCSWTGIKSLRDGMDNAGYYKCPFCDDSAAHLNISYKKNSFRCNRCGEGGGVLRFLELYYDISHEEALSLAHEISDTGEPDDIVSTKSEANQSFLPNFILNKVYKEMLSLLFLSDKHKKMLLKRGLSIKAIIKLGYKSTPSESAQYSIPKELVKRGYDLKGVPGFFIDITGKWKINVCASGYFVPFKDEDGCISGMQIRCDTPYKGARYITFSSTGLNEGSKPCFSAHIVGYSGQKTIYLTEGALKSDIASYLSYKLNGSKHAFVGIAGVNNTAALPDLLHYFKLHGVKKVVECFDMDKVGNSSCELNENVKKAQNKIHKIIKDSGLSLRVSTWPTQKGIDDYLLEQIRNVSQE